MEGYKPIEYPEGTQSINVDDIPQEQVDAFEKYLEGMTQETMAIRVLITAR